MRLEFETAIPHTTVDPSLSELSSLPRHPHRKAHKEKQSELSKTCFCQLLKASKSVILQIFAPATLFQT